MTARRVCLAIGISKSDPLPYLPGAAQAAEDIGEWARKSHFDSVRVLTDSRPGSAVSESKLQEAMDELLEPHAGVATSTFVLFFAGHGLREGAENHLWLLSDWREKQYAISVNVLRRRLGRFGIQHLAIFSDSCRSIPDAVDFDVLDRRGVLPRGPYEDSRPEIDRFNAVQDGKEAYMVPGQAPEEARCIFSGVVVEGLWGHRSEAFEQGAPGRVTSESLTLFLRRRVPEVGLDYRLECEPDCVPGIPRDHIVYFDPEHPPSSIPAAVRWPPPTGVAVSHGVVRFDEIVSDQDLLRKVLGPEFGKNNQWIETEGSLPPVPETQRDELEFLATARSVLEKAELDPAERYQAEWEAARARLRIEAAIAAEARRRKRYEVGLRLAEAERARPSDVLSIDGEVRRVWARAPKEQKDGRKSLKRRYPDPDGEQLLVEFEDGTFVPVPVHPRHSTVLSYERQNGPLLAIHSRERQRGQLDDFASDIISRLADGSLRASQVDAIAVALREEKHKNLLLGVVAAYLYDFVGDIDNIRRMAYYYVRAAQPIPYDLVFLGMLETSHSRPRSALRARVPAVLPRDRTAGAENLPQWVTEATPPVEGTVLGCMPLLRQGWDSVRDSVEIENGIAHDLGFVAPHVRPTAFTSLTEKGGRILIERWGFGEA